MQRDIDCCGCEFRVDYEWDDKCLVIEGISIDGNDLTDLLLEKVTGKIEAMIYEYYGEDLADRAAYYAEMRRAA